MNDHQQVSEQELMRAVQEDAAQFERLYRLYVGRVYAYCYRRVGNHADAEDVCSQVFIRIWRSLPTYKGGMAAAWIFRIAYHTVCDYFRTLDPLPVPLENVATLEDNSRRLFAHVDNQLVLQPLYALLSDEQMHLLCLYLDARMTSKEIGVAVGKSAVQVRVELHRLIRKLRAHYQPTEEVER